jgi:ElaB/YqjD/DUF883 family membrane-anchored ribosome-binding protein
MVIKMNLKELATLTSNIEQIISTGKSEDEHYFKIDNEILKNALTDQVRLHHKWEHLLSGSRNIFYEAETYMEAAYSKALSDVLSNSNVDYTTTEAKILAQKDSNYVEVRLLYNRISNVKKDAESVLRALETRKWILKNITDLVVQGVDNHII